MTYTVPQQKPPSEGITLGRIIVWFVVLGLMFWPRLFIVGFAIFTPLIHRAFSTGVAILGFVLLPWTTFAYACMWSITSHGVTGWEWVAVAIGFLIDLYAWFAGWASLH